MSFPNIVLGLLFALMLNPIAARAQEVWGGTDPEWREWQGESLQGYGAYGVGATGGCGRKKSKFNASEIAQFAREVHGSKSRCYMRLYKLETGANPACVQYSVPNPPALGLCTLEGDPTVRQPRGGPCRAPNSEFSGDTEAGIKNQMKCCAYIMRKSGNGYFQPVREGRVANCERGERE